MEVKKNKNCFELCLDSVKITIDPDDLKNVEPPIILTDLDVNINKDKIFNSAGEYNLGNVYFWGFQDEKRISYLFENEEGRIFLARGKVKDETIKEIRVLKNDIDVFLSLDEFDENVFQNLKPKIILTNKNIQKQGFKKEKGKSIKLNLKKADNLIFVFE